MNFTISAIDKEKYAVALLSVLSNSLLVALKLVVGLAMGSISVISEAIHSGVDVLAAIVAVVGVKRSCEPADSEHAFGHGKLENLSGLVQAVLIFVAAAWIIWEAVHKLIQPAPIETLGIGVAVMLVSAVVNAVVARLLFRVGEKSDSIALKADAWHCLTDVYASAGVMVGLGVVWAGKAWLPGMNLLWVDSTTAILVALLIIKAAYDLTLESLSDLLDVSLPLAEQDEIKNILKGNYPYVIGYHKFRSRKAGSTRFVEFHLLTDNKMSVGESHNLHHMIEEQVKKRFPGAEMMIHIEPCTRTCAGLCVENCFDPQVKQT